MTLSFPDRVALLEQHGRAAVDALAQLAPDAAMPPRDDPCRVVALEHRDTVAIWAWCLENPGRHWRAREAPTEPHDDRAVVSDIARQLGRVVSSLRAVGPDLTIDYFDRPGTTAEVARLLAYEAIAMAHAATIAAGRPSPRLAPEAACDGVDHVLDHWASPRSDVEWRRQPVAIRSTACAAEWFIDVPASSDDVGELRPAAPTATPAAVVQGLPADILWWLHGYPTPTEVGVDVEAGPGRVTVRGDVADVRALHEALCLPVPKSARRRWRWFG
jgi:hypothetical protein